MKTIYMISRLPKISLVLLVCLLYLPAVKAADSSDTGSSQPSSVTVKKKKKTTTRTTTKTNMKPNSGVTLTTPEPKTPIEHNNRGCELGMKGLWEPAIHEHELALNADPENHQFRVNLSSAQMLYARQLASKGKIYEAMNHYRESLYVDPSNAEADQALDVLVERTLHKNDLATRMNEADKADIAGNYVTAIVEYRKCVMMSDTGAVRARLGRVLLKQGKVVEGFSEIKAAVAKPWAASENNDLADCHRQLAEILKEFAFKARDRGDMGRALKRLENAEIEYRRAVTLNPLNSDAIAGLVEVAREGVAIKPSFDNHLTLAGAYQLAGDYERAKMEYEACWKLDRNNSVLAAARRSFHLAVVSHPRSPVILAATVQKIEDSLKQTPNDPELLYILGRGKEAQGEIEQALRAYETAAAINPLIYPDLKDRIASLINGGQKPAPLNTAITTAGTQPAGATAGATGAATAATAAAGVNQSSIGAGAASTGLGIDVIKNLNAYAEIENKMRTNDLDGAEKLASALVEKDPHNGKGWLILGRIAEKKSDLDTASVSYRQAADLKEPEAKAALEQIDSSRVQPMLKEAELAAKQNNWVMAAANLKDAVTLAPNLIIVHRKLAEALKQLGDTKGSQRESKKADELEKAN
jgi:tetratricopeptide (TPR) repeat protein